MLKTNYGKKFPILEDLTMNERQLITRDDDVRLAIAKSATYHNSVIGKQQIKNERFSK